MSYFKNYFIILILFITFSVRAEYDPTNSMIAAFCQDVGPFTKVALKQIDSIISIIKQIKEDKNCKMITAATQSYLNELTIYQNDYFGNEDNELVERESRIYEDAIESQKIKLIQAHMQDYRTQNPNATVQDLKNEELAYTPTSDILTSLNDQYGQLQINTISKKIKSGRFESTKSRTSKFKVMQGLQHGLQGLYGSLNSSSQCRHDNTNLITNLGATVLGTAGNIYGGMVGAALVAGGLVITGTGEFVRDLKFNSKLADLENGKLQFAIGCSLEGISKNYCQARDVQKMIKFNLKNTYEEDTDCPDCGLVYDGIDLLARKVFIYNKWINKILAGSKANNDAQAQERIKAFELFNKLTYVSEEMTGAIGQTSTVIQQLPGDDRSKKDSQLIQLMQNLARLAAENVIVCSNRDDCSSGPYRSFFALDTDCGPKIWFYSKGATRIRKTTTGDQRETSCDTYIRNEYSELAWLSIVELEKLVFDMNKEAKSFVSSELQRVLEENPDRVMAEYTVIDPKFRSSPQEFFVGMEKYLIALKLTLDPVADKFSLRLISNTLDRLLSAKEIISKDCEDKSTIYCDIAKNQITELGILMAPKQQTFSLENALRTIVVKHLDGLIESGRIPNKLITHLIKYSNQNSPQFIIKTYFNIDELRRDTANAKMMTIGILSNLGNQFLKRYYEYLAKSIKELKKSPWKTDLKTVIATRCFQFLHIPDSNTGMFNKSRRRKILKLCKGMTYESINPEKVPSLDFNEVSQMNEDERICVLFDFKRKLNLLKLITPRGERKNLFTPIR